MEEKYLFALLTLLQVGDYNALTGIETVPNEYCLASCECQICAKNPWRILTFKSIGRIKIGWRKRVINIDWSETGYAIEPELITEDSVTKEDTYIHAHGYSRAIEYLKNIIYLIHYETCKIAQEAAGENVEGCRRLRKLKPVGETQNVQ